MEESVASPVKAFEFPEQGLFTLLIENKAGNPENIMWPRSVSGECVAKSSNWSGSLFSLFVGELRKLTFNVKSAFKIIRVLVMK